MDNVIYILKSKKVGIYGDEPDIWKDETWTDDPAVAGEWERSSEMYHKRSFVRLNKAPIN